MEKSIGIFSFLTVKFFSCKDEKRKKTLLCASIWDCICSSGFALGMLCVAEQSPVEIQDKLFLIAGLGWLFAIVVLH